MTASAQEILPDSSFDWMFWPVARLDPLSAWSGHVPFAHWLVAKARPLLIVELGTHTGVSYAAFCQAVRQASPFSRCFAVDTWQGDPQAGKYGEDVYESLKAFHDARFRGFSKLLRKTFDEAVEEFEDGTIDLTEVGIGDEMLRRLRRVFIVACGTSYHAGLIVSYAIEQLARVPVQIDVASEFSLDFDFLLVTVCTARHWVCADP